MAASKWQLSHVSNFTDIFLHTLLNTEEQKLENVVFASKQDANQLFHLLFILSC